MWLPITLIGYGDLEGSRVVNAPLRSLDVTTLSRPLPALAFVMAFILETECALVTEPDDLTEIHAQSGLETDHIS